LSDSSEKLAFSGRTGSTEALRGLFGPPDLASSSAPSDAALFPLREGFPSSAPSSASSSWVEEAWVSSDRVTEVSRARRPALPLGGFDSLGITTCGSSVKRVVSWVMTHKYRGSIVVLLISKSVEPNEEQKEMTSGFQQGILCKY
jgi:hypothetical protein